MTYDARMILRFEASKAPAYNRLASHYGMGLSELIRNLLDNEAERVKKQKEREKNKK